MEYYFNNLSPTDFQRLINSILIARFGEDVRLTPLRGADGGRDGETAPGNPFYEYIANAPAPKGANFPKEGRYVFQVKHHRTVDVRLTDARAQVVSDFESEVRSNVLTRTGDERVNYFFLITNVPSSKESILSIDRKRRELLKGQTSLHLDVWWQERLVAFLDQMSSLWSSFPDLFAGRKIPFLAEVINKTTAGLPRAVRMAIERQFQRDGLVKFKQIELEKSLTKLFVDLDVDVRFVPPEESRPLLLEESYRKRDIAYEGEIREESNPAYYYAPHPNSHFVSAIGLLLSERQPTTRKILLEGGPGQGKSTITQMMVQIYRNELLSKNDLNPEERWTPPKKLRLPFRMELRNFAEWLGDNTDGSVEEYLASIFKRDSGGGQVSVDDIHNMVEHSPALLIFDGLDEVGSDDLRDTVLARIADCISRFENDLHSDLRVIVTTRPPAIAGRREQLIDFRRFPIAPMEPHRVQNYLERWLSVQLHEEEDRQDVRVSFERRRNETHVKALAKNPMQLSVLLHFIRLKGEAFPDRRAELYRDYFRTVIDRDVEKSSELRQQRETIEVLHQLLGYKIHSLTEADKADGTLSREQLLEIVRDWIRCQGGSTRSAREIFKLGEERLGLIVALKGEGEEARYGYEIQPIREYFAAAFINEQIQGNAHDVYQALVHRSYWKEVALFLAGLRRPNEKADLITRAKAIDKNEELGWRQDGRTITLQLLQEGVFSKPGHVFSEALDFIIDLIDPSTTTPNEPKDAPDAIAALIRQGEGETRQHSTRILELSKRSRLSNDEHVLYQLYRVISKIFKEEKVKEEMLRYEGASDIKAKVKIYWPYIWGIDIRNFALNTAFWDGMDESSVAWWWWQAAGHADIATNLPASPSLHPLLCELYVTLPSVFYQRNTIGDIGFIQPLSNWAIWRLLSLQQLLLAAISPERMNEEALGKILPAHLTFDCAGLDTKTSQVISELIEKLYLLNKAILLSTGDAVTSTADYISSLRKHLSQPGLPGWIACRAGYHFFELYRFSRYGLPGRRRREMPIFLNAVEQQRDLSNLGLELYSYFGIEAPPQTHSLLEEEVDSVAETLFVQAGPFSIPTYIRQELDGNFVGIAESIYLNIIGKSELPHEWLKRSALHYGLIRPLVDKCNDCLPELLKMLGECRFNFSSSGSPLLIQSMRKILKIVRNTSESKVLEGALVALSTSNYLNVAGVELTLKMMRAVTTKSVPATVLFNLRREEYERREVKETRLVPAIAKGIVDRPEDFHTSITSAAASYLAEHSPVSLPPLLSLEDELELQVQQAAKD